MESEADLNAKELPELEPEPIVQEQPLAVEESNKAEAPKSDSGWFQGSDGRWWWHDKVNNEWWYQDENGNQVKL